MYFVAGRGDDVTRDFARLVDKLSHESLTAALEAALSSAPGAMAVLYLACVCLGRHQFVALQHSYGVAF